MQSTQVSIHHYVSTNNKMLNIQQQTHAVFKIQFRS